MDSEKKAKKRNGKIPTPFSTAQLKRLFNSFENPKIAMISFLALITGMRITEVCTTKLEEIEWDLHRINKPYTKGGKPRVYYLNKQSIKILRKWVSILGDTEYLFPSIDRTKKHAQREGVYGEFRQYLSKAGLWKVDNQRKGIKNQHVFTFHSLRTTFCSLLVNSDTDIYKTSKLMGHSKVQTTERYYAYLGSMQQKRELDRIFNSKANKVDKQLLIEERRSEPVRSSPTPDYDIAMDKDPLQILKIKLANGEISVDDYKQKAELINGLDNQRRNIGASYIG